MSAKMRQIFLGPRGDKVPSLKIMRFSMFSRFTFEQLQRMIRVTKKLLNEQCDGELKCCATEKQDKLFRIERICSVILAHNRFSIQICYRLLSHTHKGPNESVNVTET